MKNENLNTILDTTFKFAKKTAKDFYFKTWAKNPPQCPAFEGEVIHITREGWEHIIDDTSRTKMDVLGRLFVLERAKLLLDEAGAFQDYTERIINKKLHEYWIFEGVIERVSVKVVVRSITKGPKHFLSVIRKGTIEAEID